MNPIRKYALEGVWNIGFVRECLDEILSTDKPLHFDWMKHNFNDRWFADPFILDVTESHIIVLVEEYYNPIHRGRISRLKVNKQTFELEDVDTILQLDTHLSFPAISRKGDNIFIYPENCASGSLKLYQYDSVNNSCKPVRTLCNEPLTDAVISDISGKEYIMSTQLPNPNKNMLGCYDESGLVQTTMFSDNTARNAGAWFNYQGQWYRPAQDCNKTYGGAVIIQKVTMDGFKVKTEDLRRIEHIHPKLNVGCHTFNHYEGITVVDVRGYKRPVVKTIYSNLISLIGRG